MKTRFRIARHATCLLALALTFVAVSPAQMGGGMMGGGTTNGGMTGGNGTGSNTGMMGSNSLGGMMQGPLAGMMGGNSGLTIGADGTLYITRSSTSQGQTAQAAATQLAAIDTNGNAKWTLPITGSASQPALGKDGTLFVTTSDWLSWMYSGTTAAGGTTPNLLVVKPGPTSASVALTIPLQGQIASAPQIGADNAGGYIVYVITVDAFEGTSVNTSATSGTYLYAFSPAGALKYRLQLSQGGYGMMGL